MEIPKRDLGKLLSLFVLFAILPICSSSDLEGSNFEIKRLDIEVEIDTNGVSQVIDKMTIENVSPKKIQNIEIDINGRDVWDIKVSENNNAILPILVTQKDDVTHKIRIEVDIEPGETRHITLQYSLISGIIVEKSTEIEFIENRYTFSEISHLNGNEYPLSIRFWAPRGFIMTTDAGNYSLDEVGYNFLDQHGKSQEREYISLVFRKKPEKKVITVILRNTDQIDIYQVYLEETLDFRSDALHMKTKATRVACRQLGSNFHVLLPYRGKNGVVTPDDRYEIRSIAGSLQLVPKKDKSPFRAGYPLGYVVNYHIDDYDFKNPFFTVINRNISETRNYDLSLLLNKEPYVLYLYPFRHAYDFWDKDSYRIQIYDQNRTYFKPTNHTVVFMTEDQHDLTLGILFISCVVTYLIYRKGYLIGINKLFSAYICSIFLFIFSSFIVIFPAFFMCFDFPGLNLYYHLQILIITFLVIFLFLGFSKNLSFASGIFYSVVFFLGNYGYFSIQMIGKVYNTALELDFFGELLISITVFFLSLLFYLYRERKFQKTGVYLYQKIKQRTFGIPFLIFVLLYGIIFFLISSSPFIIKLIFTSILFCIFFFFSFHKFTSAINNRKFREDNDYILLNGYVSRIEPCENETIYFHFRHHPDGAKSRDVHEHWRALVYNNRLNYPIFGLSYYEIKKNMKLKIIARESDYINGEMPLKVMMVARSEQSKIDK